MADGEFQAPDPIDLESALLAAKGRRPADAPSVLEDGLAPIRMSRGARPATPIVSTALGAFQAGTLAHVVASTASIEGEAERKAAIAQAIGLLADAGSIPVATPEEIRALEARLARESWGERLETSGICDVLRREDRALVMADTLEPTRALIATQRWLDRATAHPPDRNVLVLCGPPGLGKTVAAAWALTRRGGLYASVATYLRDYERWLRDKTAQDGASPVLRRYKRAHLVVLDEVGRERDGDMMRDAFFKMVDERQSRRRELTIYITNLSREQFVGRLRSGVYDDRAASRLARDAWIPEGISGATMRKGAL